MAESHKTPAADPAYNPANPATRKTVIDNPPSGQKNDTVSVTYRPGPGDGDETEAFGKTFKAGETVEVPARFAEKVRGNPYFAIKGEKSHGDDMPQDEPEDIEPTSFDENVARERAVEYLENPQQFRSAEPGAAERVARAQDQARELQEAANDPDSDKPRRGRPPGKKAD